MLAVFALFKKYKEMNGCAGEVAVDLATTRYIVEDATSSFRALTEKLGLEVHVAGLDFSGSPYQGLRDYEEGCVKEGAGAGGAAVYAEWLGVPAARVVERVNALYREFSGRTKG